MTTRMKSGVSIAILLFSFQCVAQHLTTFVDPFIGTANGGNTFPGAVRPWGMVSVSPHTAPGSPSGYIHGSKHFYGFGQVHLSGTGCPELGCVTITASRGAVDPEPDNYRCGYADEVASAGYYGVTLVEPAVRAEATATTRCGLMKFTPLRDGDLNLLIDAGRSLNMVGGGSITFLSETEVVGFSIGGRFCGWSNKDTVYFAARVNAGVTGRGTWVGSRRTDTHSVAAIDSALGAWFRVRGRKGSAIVIKTGISYVSTRNARLNLDSEVPDWSFERVRNDARKAWEQALSRIQVEGGSHQDMVRFYTALYHVLIHPNIISDVNGDYPLMGRSGVGRYSGRDRYSVFSLWDTYRTVHPLLTLLFPERQSAIVKTMIDMYKESGWLPKWELAGNETHMMAGDPAVPVIADSYVKGITDFDTRTALDAMKKPAEHAGEPDALPARPGYHEYLQYKYIPFEQNTEKPWWVWGPVSNTLEYCLDDWAFAQMAGKMNETALAQEYLRRSLFYRNLYDSTSRFIRPRMRNGDWLTPFDPLATEGSGTWSGSGGPGYVEGNAWQYTWFVPHDIAGLANLFGGKEFFIDKLTQCFDRRYFTINNEPDIAYPYLFTYFPGEEYRTQQIVRRIMAEDFGTAPSGLPGNDDAGAISAWFVFSALGFYPACPASDSYQLGIPLFRKCTITLNPQYYPGRRFSVTVGGRKEFVPEKLHAMVNRKRTGGYSISHREIVAGGSLLFVPDTVSVKASESP